MTIDNCIMQDSLFFGKQLKSVHANFSDDDESITKNKKLTSNLSVMWTLEFTEPADPIPICSFLSRPFRTLSCIAGQ